MPTLKRFGNVRVVLWPNDHQAVGGDGFGVGLDCRES